MEVAERCVVAYLAASDAAALVAASRASAGSGAGLLWHRREQNLLAGTSRQLQIQESLDTEAREDQQREDRESWYALSDLLRDGGWTSDD